MTNDTGNAKTMGRTEAPLPEAVTSGRAGVSTDDRTGAGGEDADGGSPPSSAHCRRRRFSRFRSVLKKATSFSGWRSSVKWMTAAEDEHGSIEALAKGTHLWKVRRKKLQGVACYRRKYKVQSNRKSAIDSFTRFYSFQLDMDSLCISYVSASATNFFFSRGSGKKKKRKRDQPQRQRSSTPTTPVSADVATPEVSDDEESNVRVDIADIVEVREGFATDTFNEAAKNANNLKIATHLKVLNQRSYLKPSQLLVSIPLFSSF